MKHYWFVLIVTFFFCGAVHAQDWTGKEALRKKGVLDSYLVETYQKGIQCLNDHQYYKAFLEFSFAYEQGKHGPSTFILGLCYENGWGTKPDRKKAYQLYEEAVEFGSYRAEYQLAVYYENGWETEQDYEKAFKLYLSCAEESNFHLAQRAVGSMYFSGRGVQKDSAKASNWYEKAAEQDNPQAAYNLSVMYEKGWGCEKDLEKSRHWLKRAAQLGEKRAANKLKSSEPALNY